MQITIMGFVSHLSQRKIKTFLGLFLRTERGFVHRTRYLTVNRTLHSETKPLTKPGSRLKPVPSPKVGAKPFSKPGSKPTSPEPNAKSETEGLLDKLKALKGKCTDELRLSETMTPELEKQVLENNLNLTYLLRQALVEIQGAEDRTKHLLTLPKTLSVDEWKNLISLQDYRSRLTYLQALNLDKDSLEEIREQDEDERRKIKIFQGHHEMLRQDGQLLPSVVTEKHLIDILHLTGATKIRKYLTYMFKTEISNFNEGLRKAENVKRTEEFKKQASEKKANEKHIVYGLGENVIMHRISDSTMNSFYNWNTVREFNEWGIPLIVDMSHHQNWRMDRSYKKSLFTELINSIAVNRAAKTPFQLYFTGLQEEQMEAFQKHVPHVNEPESPFVATSQNHIDMFPTEQMVYLSPDSHNDLHKFNPNDIYVIGGIIDKGEDRQPLTLSAAKRLRIRHARFPMRQTLGLTGELNVDTCVAIMNDLKVSQDWFYSFRWVPSRHFGNRVKTNPNASLQHQLAYRAHRHLTPNSWKGETESARNLNLGPAQYRLYYQKIMDCKTPEEMEKLLEELKI